ncbi:hypothetical protein ACE5D9_01145 [Rickettsia sp. 2024-CO-Wats]|uniref:hypothetical protein n=1 Tax=unclassified Rickettsia TaxID=114295 RepID=UPI00370DCA6E
MSNVLAAKAQLNLINSYRFLQINLQGGANRTKNSKETNNISIFNQTPWTNHGVTVVSSLFSMRRRLLFSSNRNFITIIIKCVRCRRSRRYRQCVY